MDMITAYRIIDAFEAWLNGSIPHEIVDFDQTVEDVAEIRKRYIELKWEMSFADAARIARAEFMLRVLKEAA